MFCKKCGTQVSENVKFCQSCGTEMIEDAKMVSENSTVPQDNSVAPKRKIGAIFSGRIGRKHWISGFLIAVVGSFVTTFTVDLLFGIFFGDSKAVEDAAVGISYLIYIPIIILLWSLHIRRLHDLGHSGWISLVLFIPLVNFVLAILFAVSAGKPETNKYGEAPKRDAGFFDTLLNKS